MVGFRTTRKKKNDENDNNKNKNKGGFLKKGVLKDDLSQNDLTNGVSISGASETERVFNRNDFDASKTNFGVTRTEEALHDSYVNNNNNNNNNNNDNNNNNNKSIVPRHPLRYLRLHQS